MPLWLEYRLTPAEYADRPCGLYWRNGADLQFADAQLFYHQVDKQEVAILGTGMPVRKRDAFLADLAEVELAEIRYEIYIYDREGGELLDCVGFYHPFPRGTFVKVDSLPQDFPITLMPGREVTAAEIVIVNVNGKVLYRDNFTVRDITDGQIDNSQRAFQFTEK